MRRFVAAVVAFMMLACLGMALAGCDRYEPQSNEGDALRYYNDKYHANAKVTDSHALGNYALFGYNYGGMEYVMSDGASVVYIDAEGFFRDNRQSAEIEQAAKAFAEQKLAAIDGAVVTPVVTSVGWEPGFETYKGEGACWATYFDGNIEGFLRAERPVLGLQFNASGERHEEGRFSFEAAYDESSAQVAERAFIDLGDYFDINRLTLAIVDGATFEMGTTTLFDDALSYTVYYKGESPSTLTAVHFKPAFISLTSDIAVSSATPGINLKEGDLRLVERSDGFYDLQISGDAAGHSDVFYYVRSKGAQGIVKVNGIDQYLKVCAPGEHRYTSYLVDGGVYHLGDYDDVKPWVEVRSITGSHMDVAFHTHAKDQISHVKLKVIGMARKDGGTTYESSEFPSRIVGETADGWLCEVEIPTGAKRENTLSFQFTYDDDEDVTVQIQNEITLPV